MNVTKKAIMAPLALAAMFALTACGVETSSNIDFNADKLGYDQDTRTGLCFSFIASRKTMSAATTGLGMTNVPCTPEVLELVQ